MDSVEDKRSAIEEWVVDSHSSLPSFGRDA